MRIGVDVGGTFTDVVAIDEEDGQWTVVKVPTTPEDQSIAVMESLDRLLAGQERNVDFLGHGTTAGTNAFLTRRGARTALLTTEGFEDVLEFRRMDRSGILDPYDLQVEVPRPLVPGRLRFGVAERVVPGGAVERALSEAEVERVLDALRAAAPEAVAISLLWAFDNPEHEQRLAQAIRRAMPDAYVAVSHEVDPAILEYERTSTTVINAYIGPLIRRYLGRFQREAAARGLPEPTIMQSNGGMVSVEGALARPAALLESGPAAGFSAVTHLARQQNHADVLAIDMGGTSFETALLLDGEPQQVLETELEGLALRLPMLDIRSIGAGGGSVAWIDSAGALRVGPQSAGATPGPACYGRGGDEATVSDANAALGYLRLLAGGAISVDLDAATRALQRRIAEPLGFTVVGAASGVHRVVNAQMADAMRLIATERGVDPSKLVLIAYGGAGPTHAAALARELEIRTTVIPPHPGAVSALGVGTGDLAHDLSDSVLLPLSELDLPDVEARFEALEEQGLATLAKEGVAPSRREVHRSYMGRYIGQLHDLEVPLDGIDLRSDGLDAIAARFHARHQATFGFAVDTEPVFVLSLRVRAVGRISRPDFGAVKRVETMPEPRSMRRVWFEQTGFVETPTFDRAPWNPGIELAGPAIIDEYDSTTVVLPGQRWSTDATGSLIIEEIFG